MAFRQIRWFIYTKPVKDAVCCAYKVRKSNVTSTFKWLKSLKCLIKTSQSTDTYSGQHILHQTTAASAKNQDLLEYWQGVFQPFSCPVSVSSLPLQLSISALSCQEGNPTWSAAGINVSNSGFDMCNLTCFSAHHSCKEKLA